MTSDLDVAGAPLDEVLTALGAIAPLGLAETWDNVGLLVPAATSSALVRRVFFAIDLTEPVFEEALASGAELVVGYHPVLFSGIKRFDSAIAQHRVVLEAIRRNVAIYSPHTALDAAPAGMNDWLAEALGPGSSRPIAPPRVDVVGAGAGRVVALDEGRPLSSLVLSLKKHLGLAHLRVGEAPLHKDGGLVRTVAVCVGAGGALFESLTGVDLLVTGEMRHHDVLGRTGSGTSVVLAEHSNSERGYLPRYAARLADALSGRVSCVVSRVDADPLSVA